MSEELLMLKKRENDILTAINKIENGAQEYRIGQRTVRYADLATLYKQCEELERRIASMERPACTVAILRRRG